MMTADRKGANQKVHWQAHQSTNTEVPENTLAAMRYAWELGGIPELDIRQTADGVIIGMHDATPKRTTDAPESQRDRPISECTFDEVQQWDAGIKFSEPYRGERVPSLAQIFSVLAQYPERELYLDFKEVDLEQMALLIKEYGIGRQIIFCHCDHENCKTVKRLAPEVRTMQWISDQTVDFRFQETRETGFASLDIVQIHLVDDRADGGWRYRLQREFLQEALTHVNEAGLELEVLPFHFDQDSMFELLDMGIRRFAVDEPKVFVETIDRYFNR
ncbi:glycerophosphodiester phosphodiesterase family protein [Paenibacillus doosanensis]|uniref:glycerophosphodiester phosphodiesterase n=1 Tax=Paenibacillus doosanensis TaxID=1229154 RepID=UPI00218004F6|nr:glycerophosphodiester phosphodiesterase family protein [Paenibacillus doosanensis]MCS7464843.1 glycerophosphodiester phosphodiesterase family protein [Paenibacillus doosanensis]